MATDPVNILSSIANPVTTGLSQGASGFGSAWVIGIAIFIGIAFVALVGAFVYWFFWDKKQWNIIVRAHYENPSINGVSIGAGGIPTKRVRFKDGRVVYLYKSAIQGYTISPELLTWTRPREHDVVITQDKKLFVINGITDINVKRKQLGVDISYPDIEMDRQDLQKHIDSKHYDDPNERFKIIAKIAMYTFLIVGAIVIVVIAGKSYIDGKNVDLKRDNINLQVSQESLLISQNTNTFLVILSKVMPESFKAIDGQVLLNQTMTGQGT